MISEATALGLIYADFDAMTSAGDTESALDLLAMAAVAAKKSPGQMQRLTIRDHIQSGLLGWEYQDFGRDTVFEAAVFEFIVNATQPLAAAICADFGASLSRRRGWLAAWKYLVNMDLACLDSQHVSDFYDSMNHALENPSIRVDEDRFATDAELVIKSIIKTESGNQNEVDSNSRPSPQMECEYCYELDCNCDLEDQELYWNSLESETNIEDEFTSFIETNEAHRSLNLLAVCLMHAESSHEHTIDDSTYKILVRSRIMIKDQQGDTLERGQLYSRLWATILNEPVFSASFESLNLPLLEFELPPILDIHSAIPSPLDLADSSTKSEQSTAMVQIKPDPIYDIPSSEIIASTDPGSEEDGSNLKTTLLTSADRYLREVGLTALHVRYLTERAVLEPHKIWARHASVTSGWEDNREGQGYGSKVSFEMKSWAQSAASELYPEPLDLRPSPRKRSRRFYEYVWSWLVCSTIFAIVVEAGSFFWGVIGFGGTVGWFLSANYQSISDPALQPLYDPSAPARSHLQKSLQNLGMHVARQYDNSMFYNELSPSQLRDLTHGSWQPQGPPPPRLNSCTPHDAEHIAAKWMRFLGAVNCRVTQQTRDGGADVSSTSHVAEVKHHQSPVGVVFIRQIFGVATSQAKRAAFFSLSGYTKSAIQFADANDICLFQYDPGRATLAAKSKPATAALKHGIRGIEHPLS